MKRPSFLVPILALSSPSDKSPLLSSAGPGRIRLAGLSLLLPLFLALPAGGIPLPAAAAPSGQESGAVFSPFVHDERDGAFLMRTPLRPGIAPQEAALPVFPQVLFQPPRQRPAWRPPSGRGRPPVPQNPARPAWPFLPGYR
ncbi:MAG: hypothetical protein LBO77_04350 [Desulfovibrio sp.]|nr:hypothetical protein [Desulfovibrio sp.]